MRDGPILIVDDGWFPDNLSPTIFPVGYRCWDMESRWRAVPDDLKPYVWLNVFMPPEWIFPGPGYKQDGSGIIYGDVKTPYRDPEYEKKELHFLKALDYAQQQEISTVLMVRRYAKLREAAPTYEKVEDALKKYSCVKALFFDELGCGRLTEVDQEHLLNFTSLAREYGRRILWAVFLYAKNNLLVWNYLMANSKWLAFLSENSDVIVPVWKTVEPYDNMLNWADCVGMWLSGLARDWGFNFDSWYLPNYYAIAQGSTRGSFWSRYYSHSPRNEPNLTTCPPYLVKDTMILTALTGAMYFMNERESPFSCFKEGGGSLRSVLEKTFRLILKKKICLGRESVAALTKVAAANPPYEEIYKSGYTHYLTPSMGPNTLWKAVFGIPDGGLDIIPNEGRNYVVPVIPYPSPPNLPSHHFEKVLLPEEVKNEKVLLSLLAGYYPKRFTANDPNVLIFDAEGFVYITDSREIDRTTLNFTLTSNAPEEYRVTVLAEDATPAEVEVPTERLPEGGWQKKLILFPGSSILLVEV